MLLERSDPVGVRLPNTADVADLAEDLPVLEVVALEFPKFADGRAYSQARLLRERHGYRGEIRAVGDVLRDQLFFMARSGFDAFELRADRSLEDALAAFDEFSESYQPAVDQSQPLYRRARGGERASAPLPSLQIPIRRNRIAQCFGTRFLGRA
jgi:uncharacterized protein (DUF934 family)